MLPESKTWDLAGIKAFIIESRGRLNQCFRSFAKSYYNNKTKGKGYRAFNAEDDDEQITPSALDRMERLAFDVGTYICSGRFTDEKAIRVS